MLEVGIIREDKSPLFFQFCQYKKKDRTWRFCIDYRALNKITILDKFLIPTLEELMNELHGVVFFSELDSHSGYHQIRVTQEDKHKTTFGTREGHYKFLAIPFEITNASTIFQAMMNIIPFLCKIIKNYLQFYKKHQHMLVNPRPSKISCQTFGLQPYN